MRESGMFSKLVSDFTPSSILETQNNVKNSGAIAPLSPKSFYGAFCFFAFGITFAIVLWIAERRAMFAA